MNTLFVDTKTVIDSFLSSYSLVVSKEFIDCADEQLTKIFIQKTGIKPGKNVCFSISEHYIGAPIHTSYLIPGLNLCGRKLLIQLYINHNWNPITIDWNSKSGTKDYKLHDTGIDCNDIKFWFENLDTDLYVRQLYPNDKFPFKLKNLSYDLVVNRLNMDCTIKLETKAEAIPHIAAIITQIDTFINQYNLKSEREERKDGVIHNAKSIIENGNVIIYDIALGSVGFSFFKKLLGYLSKLNVFSKVEIN